MRRRIFITATILLLVATVAYSQGWVRNSRKSYRERIEALEQRVDTLESQNLKQATVISSCVYLLSQDKEYNDRMLAKPADERDGIYDVISGLDKIWDQDFTDELTTDQTTVNTLLDELNAT